MVEDLTAMIDKEMEKLEDIRDAAKIAELSKAITEICGYPESTEEDKKQCIAECLRLLCLD